MRNVEICISSAPDYGLADNIRAACRGGAARIELCSGMEWDGLTPSSSAIKTATEALSGQVQLLVMIRPREGDFVYSQMEVEAMLAQIETAAEQGANGVVLGALDRSNALDNAALVQLIQLAGNLGLSTSFHRAFDLIQDPIKALEALIEQGVDRILTSGTKWSSGLGAEQGISRLQRLIQAAAGRVEIVIGGGVTLTNAERIWQACSQNGLPVSLHAYSTVLEGEKVVHQKVAALVDHSPSLA